MQALEEEGNSEKHQLAAMHQQRVLAHINQRKREAMTCYTQALTEQPPSVSICRDQTALWTGSSGIVCPIVGFVCHRAE